MPKLSLAPTTALALAGWLVISPAPIAAQGLVEYDLEIPQIRELKDLVAKLPPDFFAEARYVEQRKAALDNKLDAVNSMITGQDEDSAIGDGWTPPWEIRDKLLNDILAKGDGCLGGLPRNDWIINCFAQEELGTKIGALIEQLENPVFGTCNQESEIADLLKLALGDSIQSFSLARIDFQELRDRIETQVPVDVPLVGPQNVNYRTFEIHLTPVLTGTLPARFIKMDNGPEAVPPDEELSWRIGCTPDTHTCGFLAFLDDEGEEAEGTFFHPAVGTFFVEPAGNLLESILGQDPGLDPCTILYNAADTNIPLGFEEEGLDPFPDLTEAALLSTLDVTEPLRHVIPIVLDGDSAFYLRDPDTVWRRQASIIGNVNLIYDIIEPASSGKFDVFFDIIGQEVWNSPYGPTTTDGDALRDQINAVDYSMVTHPKRNELSLFLVGYDMDGPKAGQAGGICGVDGTDSRTGLPWDRTFGSDWEHQWNHAWLQQVADADGGFPFSTLYGRVIAAAHEIGHMIGGLHSQGSSDACAAPSGPYSTMCGTSILQGGRDGADPDRRQPFFTDANDDKIVSCLERVVSP